MKKVALVLGILGLSACGSAPPPPKAAEAPKECEPQPAEVTITATDSSNGDAAGQGRPVQVRIYQLKTDARLKIASFEDIWQKDKETLQGDLVKVDEYTAFPRQSKRVTLASTPDANTVAAVALFRVPSGKSWFVTYELEPPQKGGPCPTSGTKLAVRLDRMQIQDGEGQSDDDQAGGGDTSASGSSGGEAH